MADKLILPQSFIDRERLIYRDKLRRALKKMKVDAGNMPHPDLNIWVRRNKKNLRGKSQSVYKVHVDTSYRLIPPEVVAQIMLQWAVGDLAPPNIMRFLTWEDQDMIKSIEKRQPLEGPKASELITKELDLRASLRKQGFDPKKEGLK